MYKKYGDMTDAEKIEAYDRLVDNNKRRKHLRQHPNEKKPIVPVITKSNAQRLGSRKVSLEGWPSPRHGGKFTPGDLVRVSRTPPRLADKYKNWTGKDLVVVDYQRTEGFTNQSEYRVMDPKSGKERWVFAEVLSLKEGK
jgi:hypothetical protein